MFIQQNKYHKSSLKDHLEKAYENMQLVFVHVNKSHLKCLKIVERKMKIFNEA
jgi:hypothetical protein